MESPPRVKKLKVDDEASKSRRRSSLRRSTFLSKCSTSEYRDRLASVPKNLEKSERGETMTQMALSKTIKDVLDIFEQSDDVALEETWSTASRKLRNRQPTEEETRKLKNLWDGVDFSNAVSPNLTKLQKHIYDIKQEVEDWKKLYKNRKDMLAESEKIFELGKSGKLVVNDTQIYELPAKDREFLSSAPNYLKLLNETLKKEEEIFNLSHLINSKHSKLNNEVQTKENLVNQCLKNIINESEEFHKNKKQYTE